MPKKEITDKLGWRVHTPNLFYEILNHNKGMWIFALPLSITASILRKVAARAIELDDEELNGLMARLTLYEQADPQSKEYNPEVIK